MLVLVVLSSCMLVGGHNCSPSSGTIGIWLHINPWTQFIRLTALYLWDKIWDGNLGLRVAANEVMCLYYMFMCAVPEFHPTRHAMFLWVLWVWVAFRVTWNTTLPTTWVCDLPDGQVQTAWVKFINTTTNSSHTEIIQISLQCATNYYIRVVVTGEPRGQGGINLRQGRVHKRKVFVSGK